MGGETFKSWTQDNTTSTEVLLSEEITSASSPNHYVLTACSLIRARSRYVVPAIENAEEIFGWSFSELDIVTRQRLCEVLLAGGYTAEAVEILLNTIRIPDGDVHGSKVTTGWMDH